MFPSVVSTQEDAPEPQPYSEDFLPPWAVAVIVIGLASVAFVIVFGVSMVRNIIIKRVLLMICFCFSFIRRGRSCREEARAGSKRST